MAATVAASSAVLIRAESEASRIALPGPSWGISLPRHRARALDCRSPRARKAGRVAFSVCLLHGLGGFWDSSDSSENGSLSAKTRKKDKALLLSLVEQIQPLDVSSISKDASADSMDAMKRTISGMLGLLPSDQFKVTIEANREPLAKLLVSSMMTGYTLRNAEYRLCLQKSLQLSEEDPASSPAPNVVEEKVQSSEDCCSSDSLEECKTSCSDASVLEEVEVFKLPENLGLLSREGEDYVSQLQEKMRAMEKELEDCKRAKTALEMEKIVGDEKNDLLDYLRSLEPDKVAELSHPASKDVEEVIQTVIDGLLNGLCKSRRSKSAPPKLKRGTSSPPWKKSSSSSSSSAEIFANNLPLKFQSAATATRDYLARLLFWCMLMGHHIRGLEYRLELSHALGLTGATVEE